MVRLSFFYFSSLVLLILSLYLLIFVSSFFFFLLCPFFPSFPFSPSFSLTYLSVVISSLSPSFFWLILSPYVSSFLWCSPLLFSCAEIYFLPSLVCPISSSFSLSTSFCFLFFISSSDSFFSHVFFSLFLLFMFFSPFFLTFLPQRHPRLYFLFPPSYVFILSSSLFSPSFLPTS